jgi:hypothetical protein
MQGNFLCYFFVPYKVNIPMYAGGFKQVQYKEYICWMQVKIYISDQTSLRICNSVEHVQSLGSCRRHAVGLSPLHKKFAPSACGAPYMTRRNVQAVLVKLSVRKNTSGWE